MKDKKIPEIILITFFIGISAFFALATPFTTAKEAREQRTAPPQLRLQDGSFNREYTAMLGDYFAENFALRQELITLNSKLHAALLNSSAVEEVVLGKDDWLFYSETLGDYLATEPMTEEEILAAAEVLEKAQNYAEAQGAKFLFVPVPNKNSLYGEYMPYEAVQGESNLERLEAELQRRKVSSLDLKEVFSGRAETLYLKADSHWNELGAAIAADAINSSLCRDSCFKEWMEAKGVKESADLIEMLYPTGSWSEADYIFSPGFSYEYLSPFRTAEDLSIETACAGGDGSLLMFRDSFGNSLHAYEAQSFATAFFSRMDNYDLGLITEKNADFVVIELVERNLSRLPHVELAFPDA